MLLIKYNPDWPIYYKKIKKKLLAALIDIEINIEHVGSTSVPLLAAKPIIDIDLVYFQDVDFQKIKGVLESAGYYHNGNQGIEGREVFKRNGLALDEILDKISHHLYVCKYDSEELQRHIYFRDYLRNHASAKEFYQNIKYRLAEEANQDRKLYVSLKATKVQSFIDYLIEISKNENQK